eukprot:RCo046343
MHSPAAEPEKQALAPKDTLHRILRWPYLTFIGDLVLCGLVFVGAVLIEVFAWPSCRGWVANDPTLSHPYATKETVPSYLLIVLCLPVALVALAVVWRVQFRIPGLYIAALTMLQALSLTCLVTNALKFYLGRLRPDWFARLAAAGLSSDPSTWESICSSSAVREGRLSCPSGHSSLMFASCGVLSFQIMAVSSGLVPGPSRYWKVLLALTPFVLSSWVAGSRTLDYRHHFTDVWAGSAVGLCCAALVQGLYFPPLWAANCDKPYSRDPVVLPCGSARCSPEAIAVRPADGPGPSSDVVVRSDICPV